jgi:hypothetical protein
VQPVVISEKHTIFLIGVLVIILVGRGHLIDKDNAAIREEESKYFQKKIIDLTQQVNILKAEQSSGQNFTESVEAPHGIGSRDEKNDQPGNLKNKTDTDLGIDSLENLITVYTDSLALNSN